MCRKIGVLLVVLSAVSLVAAQAKLDAPFQVRYVANVTAATDSYINITNSGASGGNLCVNVYAFSPDEQEVSCCSCTVTPNALVSLSAYNDLFSNTLTPAPVSSGVIKLVATKTSGACNAATPNGTGNTLATGLLAWATTVHNGPVTPQVTETAFSPATLSASEEARITSFCAFAQANGSGFGICRSCRAGGLAPKQ